jgi:hypothetical protein
MCDDCTGNRYCAYDHSDSKYFGSGKKGVRGENVDCRFLRNMSHGSRRDERSTYEAAPETIKVKTWTVPLSLQTHSSRSSGLNATP